jgi:hypothetical protein
VANVPKFTKDIETNKYINEQISNEADLELKKYLSSEKYNIQFFELIENLTNKAYENIIDHAHYNFVVDEETFNNYINIHYQTITPLIKAAMVSIKYGKSKHILAFKDVLAKNLFAPIYKR